MSSSLIQLVVCSGSNTVHDLLNSLTVASVGDQVELEDEQEQQGQNDERQQESANLLEESALGLLAGGTLE